MIKRLVLVAVLATSATLPSLAVEAQLCRSQLELLLSGNKLNEEEAANFERQCACLEANEKGNQQSDCTAER